MSRTSIVEFTPIDYTEGKNQEEKNELFFAALERLKRDLSFILSDFEKRLMALEDM